MYPSGPCSAPVGVPSYSYCECPVVSLAYGEYEDGVLEGWAASWWFCGWYAECLWGTVAAGKVLGVAGGMKCLCCLKGDVACVSVRKARMMSPFSHWSLDWAGRSRFISLIVMDSRDFLVGWYWRMTLSSSWAFWICKFVVRSVSDMAKRRRNGGGVAGGRGWGVHVTRWPDPCPFWRRIGG